MALGLLDLLPQVEHLVRRVRPCAAKDVLVAEDHFVGDGARHICDGEFPVLAGDLGVQHDLQEHVAQFVVEGVHILAVDGVHGLISLLDEVGAQRRVRLLAVPGTAARRAEDVDDAR